MTTAMKVACLLLLIAGLMGLSSCGLVRSATQLPVRTLQSVGRAVGLGLEHSEVIENGERQ
jgi:hypothetical protein